MTDRTATIVLVHGAWHGSWCWKPLRNQLRAHGVASTAVDNPSVATPASDLHADGDNLRAALDEIDGPVVLVGHSYGGAVITDAGAHPNVKHLVYLTAFALDEGESVARNELTGGEEMRLAEVMQFDGEMVSVEPSRVVEFFYHDCTPEVAQDAVTQLRPMSRSAMTGVVRDVAWRTRPSTYVVCTDDRAIPVALQRSCAQRTRNVVEMPTSHSPFLSRPGDLARVLTGLAGLDAR